MLSEAKLGQWLRCSEAFRAARGSPSRCAPTERQGCPAKATSTEPEAGGALVLHLATENNLRLCKAGPWPLPGERAGGPHITVLQRARSPHQLGKGRGQGPGTKCHHLLPALLGSSITRGSMSCPALSCLGSSAQHSSPAARAAWRLPQRPGLRQIPPGENAATRAAAAPVALGLVPGESESRAVHPPCREARVPAKPLPGVHIAQLLAIASSWLIS